MNEWPRRWNRRDEPGRHCDEYLTETSECQVSVGDDRIDTSWFPRSDN